MGWKTILVHADPSAHAPARIRVAAQLARQCGAHLVGLAATCISRDVCPQYPSAAGDIIRGYLEPVYAAANRCLDEFEALACAAGAPSVSRHLASDLPEEGLVRQASFCDLVVLSQNDPRESTSMVVSDLPEYVVLGSARPVLVVPCARIGAHIGRKVLVGWNGRNESASALAGALPLLAHAEQVTVVMFDPPPKEGPDGVHPAADLAAYLARHGVKAEVLVRHAGVDAGLALLALAGETGADLLVMGCYGHTRLRETLLGGASSTVLRAMTLPVLMAH
jgi:nucleotide-binding universal stress UspA family protein